jgi:nucleoside-diphosphate-sugar epimerase
MILVTGAGGFVGKAVVSELARRGTPCRAVTRRPREGYYSIGHIDPATDWTHALHEVETVVHLASRAHVLNEKVLKTALNERGATETVAGSPACFQSTDVDATLNLARQAARAGARRFVFISSIKVNGEATRPGRPFTAEDASDPQNPYAQSKFDAERRLFALSAETGLEVSVIRPPLVYGPGVKANFATMMEWVNRGIPLPLGAVKNRRSFVFVDNLADLIILTAVHPKAGGQVFLVSDGEDISTTELLERMAQARGRTSWVIPVPAPLLKFAATALGQRDVTSRLTDSLQVDIGKTRDLLGWAPRISVDEGLRRTARSFQRLDLALDPIARSA